MFMRYSFFGFGMLLFGMAGLVIIVLYQSITINNESSYYVLKEAMEAAMYESIDWGYCATNPNENDECEYKIIEQKFVENFTRRFAASINGDASKYKIEFYDIIEKPPKATIILRSTTGSYSMLEQRYDEFDLVNNLTGILEEYET